MNTATMIDLLRRADPLGTKTILLDRPEDAGFQECGAVRVKLLSLDEDDGIYASPWDAESELIAEEHITLLA